MDDNTEVNELSDVQLLHELQPFYICADLLFAAGISAQISVLTVRRWIGRGGPDYSGWDSQQILIDQRLGFALGLMLVIAWASITIGLIRHALHPDVASLLAAHLGPLPLPAWLVLVLQEGHRLGILFALFATMTWLDRSISKHWSRPRQQPNRQIILATLFGFVAAVAGIFQ